VKMSSANQSLSMGQKLATSLGIVLIWATILSPSVAKADGGMVRTREAQGTFIVTIFTSPEVSRDLFVEVTVMVQRRETDEAVMDAAVDLSFVPPTGVILSANDVLCGSTNNMASPEPTDAPGQPTAIRATRGRAANKLFYGATVVLRAVGDWQLRALVRQGSETASVTCTLPVGMAPRRLTGLWPYLALPPFAIVLFALNQWLRGRPANLRLN
jgi:hypothetical protein